MARDDPEQGTAEMTGRVPRSQYNDFIGRFPMYGASSWLIRTSLDALLREVENDPTLEERIRIAITESVRNL